MMPTAPLTKSWRVLVACALFLYRTDRDYDFLVTLQSLQVFAQRKTLENRSYTRQNLASVLNRVGSTFIIFFGILIGLVIAVPGFTPGQLMSALGIGSVAIGFAFKDIFRTCSLAC